MAYNPSPKVAAARDIGQRFSVPQVVVLLIDRERGVLEYASWGKTKVLCAEARGLGDAAFEAVVAANGI